MAVNITAFERSNYNFVTPTAHYPTRKVCCIAIADDVLSNGTRTVVQPGVRINHAPAAPAAPATPAAPASV